MGQRDGAHAELLILPVEVGRFGVYEVQRVAQGGVAVIHHCGDQVLHLDGGDDIQWLRTAEHGGTGEQPRQTEGVVAVDVGDEYGPQLHHRVASTHQLVLRTFATVHQVPGFGAGVAQGQAGDVA